MPEAQVRFRLSRLDVSLWQGDTCILGAHPQNPADRQKIINVCLCANQVTFTSKNLPKTNAVI